MNYQYKVPDRRTVKGWKYTQAGIQRKKRRELLAWLYALDLLVIWVAWAAGDMKLVAILFCAMYIYPSYLVIRREKDQPGEILDRTRSIPQDVKISVAVRDRGRCVYCGSNRKLHYDHVYPYSKGGSNDVDNLQLLCQDCNLRKSDMWR